MFHAVIFDMKVESCNGSPRRPVGQWPSVWQQIIMRKYNPHKILIFSISCSLLHYISCMLSWYVVLSMSLSSTPCSTTSHYKYSLPQETQETAFWEVWERKTLQGEHIHWLIFLDLLENRPLLFSGGLTHSTFWNTKYNVFHLRHSSFFFLNTVGGDSDWLGHGEIEERLCRV